MKAVLIILYVAGSAAGAAAEPVTGDAGAVCRALLDARRVAESEGRLDFSVAVDGAGDEVTARVQMGSPYNVGRITFTGHDGINDSTLRRAMTLYERDRFDVTKLRRSLTRINGLGVFEPVTLSDLQIANRADGITADLTIPLRERKRRWWSVSGPVVPGLGWLQASISSRLPPWGRGVFEASTYFVTFNAIGFVPALVRPVIPGQEWFSGFVISPKLSPRKMVTHYGTTHLARSVGSLLEADEAEPLVVPRSDGEMLVCHPPKARLWWLRRGLATAVNIALAH